MNQLVRNLRLESLTLTPLTPTIGAEVSGVDLSEAIDAAYWPAVRRMERVTVIGDRPY